MKVFIVHGDDYEDQVVRTVYSTVELAIKHVEKFSSSFWKLTFSEYEIRDYLIEDDEGI